MRRFFAAPVAVLAATPAFVTPALAQAPDLAAYDCTRTDDGTTVPGDKLAAQGFGITSQARFGSVNLMLKEPKTMVRANCFKRQPK